MGQTWPSFPGPSRHPPRPSRDTPNINLWPKAHLQPWSRTVPRTVPGPWPRTVPGPWPRTVPGPSLQFFSDRPGTQGLLAKKGGGFFDMSHIYIYVYIYMTVFKKPLTPPEVRFFEEVKFQSCLVTCLFPFLFNVVLVLFWQLRSMFFYPLKC